MNSIEGLVVAPFTPMKEDGSIQLDMIPPLYEHYREQKIVGAFINGSTGEGLSLTTRERKQLAEKWNETITDDFKLLIHVGHAGVEDAKSLGKHAAQLSNVTGISTVGPFYRKPADVGGLVDFCQQVAEAAPEVPFYYYHIPALTEVNFSMVDFLAEGSEKIPMLSGIKFSNYDYVDFSRCLEFADGKYDIMFGNDELMSCGLILGARGFVGSTYNLFPGLYHEILAAYERGDLSEVRRLQRKSMEFVRLIDQYEYGGAAKGVMKLLGLDCGPARLPLQTIDAGELTALEKKLRETDFFSYAMDKAVQD
ncbi:dihydrodipicolinate synthase family protein [Fodinibius sp.]|uniref:dihydrodipicolinate synthase family protein n=1 Tax=Fodinibius sp. TaxID=1872440 RepID=UPI0035647C7C